MEIINKYYQMDRSKISFLRYILEAYDNACVLTTEDRDKGAVVVRVTEGFEEEVEIILEDLKDDLKIKPFERE